VKFERGDDESNEEKRRRRGKKRRAIESAFIIQKQFRQARTRIPLCLGAIPSRIRSLPPRPSSVVVAAADQNRAIPTAQEHIAWSVARVQQHQTPTTTTLNKLRPPNPGSVAR